jgi:hypothetical protein
LCVPPSKILGKINLVQKNYFLLLEISEVKFWFIIPTSFDRKKNLELAWVKSQSFIDWTSLVEKSWNHRVANSINARPLWAGLMNEYQALLPKTPHLTKSTIHIFKINKWIERKIWELCSTKILLKYSSNNSNPSNSSNDRFAQEMKEMSMIRRNNQYCDIIINGTTRLKGKSQCLPGFYYMLLYYVYGAHILCKMIGSRTSYLSWGN